MTKIEQTHCGDCAWWQGLNHPQCHCSTRHHCTSCSSFTPSGVITVNNNKNIYIFSLGIVSSDHLSNYSWLIITFFPSSHFERLFNTLYTVRVGDKEKRSEIACERQFVKEGRDRKRNREKGRNGDAVPYEECRWARQ